MMARVSEVILDDIVFRIGVELRRSEKGVLKECHSLRENWETYGGDKWSRTINNGEAIITSQTPFMGTNAYCSKLFNANNSNNPSLTEKQDSLGSYNSEFGDKKCEIINITQSTISILIDGTIFEFYLTDTINIFSEILGGDVQIYEAETNKPFDKNLALSTALLPRNRLLWNTLIYSFEASYQCSAVDAWLNSLSLSKYINIFRIHGVDDYLALPFLSKESLRKMDIIESDIAKLYSSICTLRNQSSCGLVTSWMYFLGFEDLVPTFLSENIDLSFLLVMNESELHSMKGLSKAGDYLWDIICGYKKFSSVEETFKWLLNNNFESYSFHFARYNIPFYALPFVNFFIINEMGVTIDDDNLLNALQQLKNSATYNAKAVTFWLRDLELENYSTLFSRNGFDSLDKFSSLEEDLVSEFIDDPVDIEKLKTGIREMKEFQFYYTATSTLLRELGMGRYADNFAQQGISIDILPLLSEIQLIELGVTEEKDRTTLMNAILKIQSYSDDTDEYNGIKPIEKNIGLPKPPNIQQPNEKEPSIDEWMKYINTCNSEKPSTKRNTRKNKRKRRKTDSPASKSNITNTTSKSNLSPNMCDMDTNNNNIEVCVDDKTEEFVVQNTVNCTEKLVIRSPHMYSQSGCEDILDDISLDSCELEELNAEVEAFRKRLEAASIGMQSTDPLFSSPD